MRLKRGLRTFEADEWTLEEDGVTSVEEDGVTSVEEDEVTSVEEDGVACTEEYVESTNEPLRFMPGCPGIDWSPPILSCS